MAINMLSFLGRRVFFKAVPRPVCRTYNGIPHFFHSSKPVLEHLESFSAKRLEDFEKELPEERRIYWGRIKGILTEHEELKRELAIEKKSSERCAYIWIVLRAFTSNVKHLR